MYNHKRVRMGEGPNPARQAKKVETDSNRQGTAKVQAISISVTGCFHVSIHPRGDVRWETNFI